MSKALDLRPAMGPLTLVSNPTPTPSMDASIRKAKGADGSFAMSSVLTKPQLFNAA